MACMPAASASSRRRQTVVVAFPSRRTVSNAGRPSRRQSGSGLPTSPLCGRRKDGSLSRLSSTCSAVEWPVSRCASGCSGHWRSPDCGWPGSIDGPRVARSFDRGSRYAGGDGRDNAATFGMRRPGQRRDRNAVRFVEGRAAARNALCDTPSGQALRQLSAIPYQDRFARERGSIGFCFTIAGGCTRRRDISARSPSRKNGMPVKTCR
jgi:hypothetical protein